MLKKFPDVFKFMFFFYKIQNNNSACINKLSTTLTKCSSLLQNGNSSDFKQKRFLSWTLIVSLEIVKY